MIRFNCETCGKIYEVENKYAGKSVKCKKCTTKLIIPTGKNEPEKDQTKEYQILDEIYQDLPAPEDSDTQNPDQIYGLQKETKTCPFCGEEILKVAKKCKHCGEFLGIRTPIPHTLKMKVTKKSRMPAIIGFIVLIIVLCGVAYLYFFTDIIQKKPSKSPQSAKVDYENGMEPNNFTQHKGKFNNAKMTAIGRLKVTATYFYNDFKGNVPGTAVVFAIPIETGLQGKKIPGQYYSMLEGEIAQVVLTDFMEKVRGSVGWAGGDGKAELRLFPGTYRILVLMDIKPYFYTEYHKQILAEWFTQEFAECHAVLGRYKTKLATVYPGETTEMSINLK